MLEDLHDKVDELEEEIKTNASTRASLRVGQPSIWTAASAHMLFCGVWCAGAMLPRPLAAHSRIAVSQFWAACTQKHTLKSSCMSRQA